jgi:uncharacterized lipoprotein YddW (UPF0748 family)
MSKLAKHSGFSLFLLAFCAFIACNKPDKDKEPGLPPEAYVIESIKLFSINNVTVPLNYNINGLKIDGLAENDGVAGNVFKIQFTYPKNITAKSVKPDLANAVDFATAQNFEVTFDNGLVKNYTVNIKEGELSIESFEVDSVSAFTDQSTWVNANFSRSGTDFIGLMAQSAATNVKIKFNFPSKVTPISILPDPNSVLDYSVERKFEIKYTNDITKTYTVKIGRHNPSAMPLTQVRGVWLTNVASQVLLSRAGIQECVTMCKDLGINTIFVVTFNNSKTMFRSQVMKEYFGTEIDPVFGARDPLAELLEIAKPQGIRVVAWFEYGFASVYGDPSGGSIIARYPSWASRDGAGMITQKNNFYWVDPFNPDVQRFQRRLITEVVEKYPTLDGIQGDDRLPALPSNGGYNAAVQAQYKKETGLTANVNPLENSWLQWRANKLTEFGNYLFKHVKSVNSKFMVSMAPSSYSWCLQNYLQDWPAWVRNKQVDYIHTQLYRRDFPAYKIELDKNYTYMNTIDNKAIRFSPGVLLGDGGGDAISAPILSEIMNYNRSIGLKGETFFYFERIKRNTAFQDTIRAHYLRNP